MNIVYRGTLLLAALLASCSSFPGPVLVLASDKLKQENGHPSPASSPASSPAIGPSLQLRHDQQYIGRRLEGDGRGLVERLADILFHGMPHGSIHGLRAYERALSEKEIIRKGKNAVAGGKVKEEMTTQFPHNIFFSENNDGKVKSNGNAFAYGHVENRVTVCTWRAGKYIETTTTEMSARAADVCTDEWNCTDDICDPALGCIHVRNNANCADSFPCTIDTCSPNNDDADEEGCVHIPTDELCSDAIECTIDRCDPGSAEASEGCVNTPNHLACDDGILCNGSESCSPDFNDLAADSRGCVVSLCDANGDGVEDQDDLVVILDDIIAGTNNVAADINRDGVINAEDAFELVLHLYEVYGPFFLDPPIDSNFFNEQIPYAESLEWLALADSPSINTADTDMSQRSLLLTENSIVTAPDLQPIHNQCGKERYYSGVHKTTYTREPSDPEPPKYDTEDKYDANAQATWKDKFWLVFFKMGIGATEVTQKMLDAQKQYVNFLAGRGKPTVVDYRKAMEESDPIRTTVNIYLKSLGNVLREMHDGTEESFSFYTSGPTLFVNGNSDDGLDNLNWAYALGGHRIWFSGKVTYDASRCTLNANVLLHVLDWYNFNWGQKALKSGVPDDANARLEQLGLGHPFWTSAELELERSYPAISGGKLACCAQDSDCDGYSYLSGPHCVCGQCTKCTDMEDPNRFCATKNPKTPLCVENGPCAPCSDYDLDSNHFCRSEFDLKTDCSASGECACRSGYTGDAISGCVGVSKCLENNGGCDHNCHYNGDSSWCTCNEGYILNTDGLRCDNLSDCESARLGVEDDFCIGMRDYNHKDRCTTCSDVLGTTCICHSERCVPDEFAIDPSNNWSQSGVRTPCVWNTCPEDKAVPYRPSYSPYGCPCICNDTACLLQASPKDWAYCTLPTNPDITTVNFGVIDIYAVDGQPGLYKVHKQPKSLGFGHIVPNLAIGESVDCAGAKECFDSDFRAKFKVDLTGTEWHFESRPSHRSVITLDKTNGGNRQFARLIVDGGTAQTVTDFDNSLSDPPAEIQIVSEHSKTIEVSCGGGGTSCGGCTSTLYVAQDCE